MKVLKSLFLIVFGIIFFLIIFGIIMSIGGLVVWGIGNAIIFLLGLNYAWTFLHGVFVTFIIWGIGFMIKNFMNLKNILK